MASTTTSFQNRPAAASAGQQPDHSVEATLGVAMSNGQSFTPLSVILPEEGISRFTPTETSPTSEHNADAHPVGANGLAARKHHCPQYPPNAVSSAQRPIPGPGVCVPGEGMAAAAAGGVRIAADGGVNQGFVAGGNGEVGGGKGGNPGWPANGGAHNLQSGVAWPHQQHPTAERGVVTVPGGGSAIPNSSSDVASSRRQEAAPTGFEVCCPCLGLGGGGEAGERELALFQAYLDSNLGVMFDAALHEAELQELWRLTYPSLVIPNPRP